MLSAKLAIAWITFFYGLAALALDFPYAADVNNDGRVSVLDLIQVRNAFFASPATSRGFWSDVNRDGHVNVLDLIAIRNNMNTPLPQREFFFDFGTPGSPVAPGTISVNEATDYSPDLGYGWDYPADRSFLTSVDRGWAHPVDRDLIMGAEAAGFRIDLPNGGYEVWVTCANTPGSVQMHFGITGGTVVGSNYTHWLYGESMDWITTSAPKNVRRFLDVAVDTDHIEIYFYPDKGSSWGVSAVEIRKDQADLVLHDAHVAEDKGYDYSPQRATPTSPSSPPPSATINKIGTTCRTGTGTGSHPT